MTSALKITLPEFSQALSRYDTLITSITHPKPPFLTDLDPWRRHILPGLIASRTPPYMTKDELYKLMECKLKRGKSRPLLPLILRNAPSLVHTCTQTAFSTPDLSTSLQHLCKLTGVGPATAGYILAAQRPEEAVVFSDEGFRWVVCGGDWGANMKYTKEEYLTLVEGVKEVQKRLGEGVKMEEVERVGFVLGREAGGDKGTKPGRKRKVEDEEEQAEEKGRGKKGRISKGKELKEGGKEDTTGDTGKETKEQTVLNTSGRILRSRKKLSG
ncbi:hypothetical protein FPQ18DRAFT_411630 [Pyronema domesticum]|uniref:Uncharacterized protein n=1 Tax=Pyronema omphalodes (strain CBS 100304) TaxID=1076935 RepID=U4LCL5_PYROM|nr:hypothetical protein FPQ18DRAFT_411630 [Pyronema domesticum]CCX29814.1 Similar to hypothetical protein PTT_19694 [Pyrenophora teres f. teres 0-1]; acc. no. XP_003306528 [Pyronema omphalodes CBS 100304]